MKTISFLCVFQAAQTTVVEGYFLGNTFDGESLSRVLDMEKRCATLDRIHLSLHAVRCSTHTLDLGVKDTIGKKEDRLPTDPCIKYAQAIEIASTVVAKLRSTKFKIAIESEDSLLPVSFIELRWSSANSMVNIISILQTSSVHSYQYCLERTKFAKL